MYATTVYWTLSARQGPWWELGVGRWARRDENLSLCRSGSWGSGGNWRRLNNKINQKDLPALVNSLKEIQRVTNWVISLVIYNSSAGGRASVICLYYRQAADKKCLYHARRPTSAPRPWRSARKHSPADFAADTDSMTSFHLPRNIYLIPKSGRSNHWYFAVCLCRWNLALIA